jgi:hypothetical protein
MDDKTTQKIRELVHECNIKRIEAKCVADRIKELEALDRAITRFMETTNHFVELSLDLRGGSLDDHSTLNALVCSVSHLEWCMEKESGMEPPDYLRDDAVWHIAETSS